ncbi:MAG: sigma-70 family RNA polymerase sigma factor [Ruminococcus sp.]|nr:sigma-70 family RNA polymerase sigma factor [Ruminococcus sp.]
MTDSELLGLYKTDVSRAVRLTAEIYHSYVQKIVSGRLAGAPREDIEEAVNDVFIRFWQDVDRVDLARGSIKAYISVLAQSIAVNRYRQLARHEALPLDEAAAEAPQEQLIEREALIAALKALDLIDRRIVLMRHYYLMPHADIAKALGMKEPAVRKRLERALKKLRTEGLL